MVSSVDGATVCFYFHLHITSSVWDYVRKIVLGRKVKRAVWSFDFDSVGVNITRDKCKAQKEGGARDRDLGLFCI